MISLKEVPERLLSAAARGMPVERHEWGRAMLAELAQLRNPATRWRFALGCTWVALFPPNKNRLLQIIKLDTDMKTPRKLGLVAIVLLIISHFLPAYGDGSGFACFGVCWNMLLGHDTEILSGEWFYYSGFVMSNILFIGLVVALFVTKKSRRLRLVVSVVFFLHVLSWLVQPSQITEIKIGYYVWLIAYGLLVAAHLWKEPAESLDRAPLSAFGESKQ